MNCPIYPTESDLKITNERYNVSNSRLDLLQSYNASNSRLDLLQSQLTPPRHSCKFTPTDGVEQQQHPPPIPLGIISTNFGPGILHRSDKPGSLTKNIPSIPEPNQSKYSKIPIPAAPSTFPNSVDRKNIHKSPQSANRFSAKCSRTN